MPGEYDIAESWHVWLFFGVVITATYLVWSIFHLIAFLCKGTPHSDSDGCDQWLTYTRFPIQTVFFVIGIVWTIFGSVLRFGHEGDLASSSLLNETGTFIKVYLIIMYSSLGIYCAMNLLCCYWVCMMAGCPICDCFY